jgi:hypothetical protein
MKRTKKHQVMKTKTYLPTLLLIISLMFVANTFALKRDVKLEEETYIDDIPFDTEWVVKEVLNPVIDFEDEADVDDIPFNTAYLAATTTVYEMEEEAYVDDIPMNTEMVVNLLDFDTVDFEDEANVDDIPFNTAYVAATAAVYEMETEVEVEDIPFNTARVIAFELEDEAYVNDIPFDTQTIASEYYGSLIREMLASGN